MSFQHLIRVYSCEMWAWCKSGTMALGPGTSRPWDSGTPSKFKSGTLIITFLHYLTYLALEKIYIRKKFSTNRRCSKLIPHFREIFNVTLGVPSLVGMERSMQLVWRPTYLTIHEIKQFHLSDVPLVWQPKNRSRWSSFIINMIW